MNTLNNDTTFSIINFLDNKSIYNLSITDKNHAKLIKNNEKIILRNIIIKNWGYEIYKLIKKTNTNMKELTIKRNMKNYYKILDLFYKEVLQNNLNVTTKLFVEIYDVVYMFSNWYTEYKDSLFNHRIVCIKKYTNNKIDENDKKVNNVINSTRYLNKYCITYQREVYDVLSNKKIIELINLYPKQR